jgi:hypothetical protein
MNTNTHLNTTIDAGNGHSASILEMPTVEPWPEPVDGAVLLSDLKETFRRFVVLPKWAAETLALWTVHTYVFQCRDVSTYLGVESPEKRCGKTTLLTLLSELVHRPVVAANISSPALFRVIEEVRPTLLIDEADTFLQGNDELRGILNSGYSRKTAYVVRVANRVTQYHPPASDGEAAPTGDGAGLAARNTTRLVRFSCWCPKILAAIGRLPETLADRCIVLRMQRKTERETCERLKDLDALPLRQRCARFAHDQGLNIAAAMPAMPRDMHDRAGDIWEPLLALADLAGGPWPEWARQAATGLTVSAQGNSPMVTLLSGIALQFFSTGAPQLSSCKIVASLNNSANYPWETIRQGKKISEHWLAEQLRPYGIRPRTIRIGPTTAKGYYAEEFMEVFRRYVPKAEFEAYLNALEGKEEVKNEV